ARQRSASIPGGSASGGSANDRFDAVSRQVALAGDVQSNLGALRGLTGLAGAGGLSGAIGGLGEVVALAEELPRLKAAAAGLPDVLKAATQTIGVGGAGMIGALGALAIAFALAQAAAQKARQAAESEIDARERALRLIVDGNQETIQARINELAKQRDVNQAIADDNRRLFEQFREQIAEGLNPLEKGQLFAQIITGVGEAGQQYLALEQAANQAAATLAGTSNELNLLQQASGLTAQSTADLVNQEQALAFARRRTADVIAAANNALNAQLEARQLAESGTTEQLQKRIQSLRDEYQLVADTIVSLGEKAKAEAADSEARILLVDEIMRLTMRANTLKASLDTLGTSTLEASIKAREAAEYAAKQQAELAAAAKKYTDDVARITGAGREAELQASARHADALVKAAQQAAEAAENALNRLQEKRSELANKLAEGEADAALKAQQQALDDQISFQRDEARAAREHARTLVQIRRDANRDEQRLIDERDFRGLFELRQSTTEQINEASRRFAAEREEANTAYAEQAEDRAAAFAVEREQRLTNYKRAINDAQAQYNREIQQIAANKSRQIQLTNQAYTAEINQLKGKVDAELRLRLQAYDAELRLVSQSASQRIAIEQAAQNAMLSLANARLNTLRMTGSNTGSLVGNQTINGLPASFAFRSGGGGLNAGQASTYNERAGQRERFAGHLLPEGAGVIFPFRAGYMNPGGTSKPMTFNAPLVSLNVTTGGSAAQMSSLSDMVADKVLDVLEVINGGGNE
ncbi:MAG: hypothetical protein JNJ78_14705, partial [Anaerolineae bacterium]|nr:hypothetical protein [Anaerolineae bacterium]